MILGMVILRADLRCSAWTAKRYRNIAETWAGFIMRIDGSGGFLFPVKSRILRVLVYVCIQRCCFCAQMRLSSATVHNLSHMAGWIYIS